MYQKPFLITKAVSNNAFNFEKRPNPQIYVPAIKNGTIQDVKLGEEIVFEDFDDREKLNSCKGLKVFVKAQIGHTPIYIFDNHNHAFYFWLEGKKDGFLQDGATLIHVDQHKDNRIPESFLTKEDSTNLGKVFDYTNTILNVGNFIPAAEHIGLIKEIIFINSETSLLELNQKIEQNPEKINPSSNLILDIDLDYFAPEFDYIDNKLKVEVLRKLVPQASLITVATSPFFIDQTLALKYLHQIFD